MPIIGKVQDLTKTEFIFEWRIEDFFSLSEEVGQYYSSPPFVFDGESWHLNIYPNGDKEDDSVGYISVYLWRELSGISKNLSYTLALKTVDDKIQNERQASRVFTEAKGRGYPCFLKRSQLLKKKTVLVPSGVLTVLCTLSFCSTDNAENILKAKCSFCKQDFDEKCVLSHEEKCPDKPIGCSTCKVTVSLRKWPEHECRLQKVQGNIQGTKCPYCKQDFDEKSILSHEQNCPDKPIGCSNCNDTIPLRRWSEHECGLPKVQGSDCIPQHPSPLADNKMFRDLKELFLMQEHCDVILKVKGKEFQAHKAILIARSPEFASIFTKEKSTRTIDIEDCDPNYFLDFLRYLYCGYIENLSTENVFGLFIAADIYDVQDLRIECLQFIKSNLSVDTFCETVTIALQRNEKELINLTLDFFAKHFQEITVTEKLKSLLVRNPGSNNDTMMKSLIFNKK